MYEYAVVVMGDELEQARVDIERLLAIYDVMRTLVHPAQGTAYAPEVARIRKRWER